MQKIANIAPRLRVKIIPIAFKIIRPLFFLKLFDRYNKIGVKLTNK